MTLLPTKRIKDIKESKVDISQVDVFENSISGDAIVGGKITKFRSQGIDDKADSLQLTVKNDVVEVEKDLHIKGSIRVDNLQYNHASVPKLNVQKALMIDHNEVLWKTELGRIVKKSNLEELGVLNNLKVKNTMYVANGRVGINTEAPSADFSVNVGGYEVITRMHERNAYVGTYTPIPFAIGTDDTSRITCKSNGDITVGNEDGKPISMNVFGKLGIGVKNPQEILHVNGNIKFADRTFTSGTGAPSEGRYDTGSIAWNDKPEINQPIGWVCVKGGQPGSWRPFGLIS